MFLELILAGMLHGQVLFLDWDYLLVSQSHFLLLDLDKTSLLVSFLNTYSMSILVLGFLKRDCNQCWL